MRSVKFIVAIALAVALVVAAFRYAEPLPSTNFDETFLPKVSSVRYMSVGNDASVAGLFWIMGLTELGDSYLSGKHYAYLGHVADICTSLDSLFYTPYYFVGSITPNDSQDTTDYPVMRRGVTVFPDDWRMAVSFALRLSKGPTADKKGAADIMRRYIDSPDTTIPEHIRTMYRTFELDTMQTEIALESALNDVVQPKFKKFKTSFYSKIYRVLGYQGLLTDENNKAVYDKIQMVVDDLSDGKASLPQAYTYLLQLRKPDEPDLEKTAEVQDSVAVDEVN